MSEASAPAAPSAPETSSAPAESGAPANDNAQPTNAATEPVVANDNAQPTADDVWHAENLAEDIAGKRWRLKHGDQERVVDTKELLRLGQIGHAGYEAFRQAAEQRKAVEAKEQKLTQQMQTLQRRLADDPYETLVELGYEDALLAAIERRVQYQQLNPEERARHDIDRERQRLEAERQAWQRQQMELRQQQEQRVIQAQAQQAEATFRQQYTAALDAVGMPADPDLRDEAIRRMAAEHERTFEQNVPIEMIARAVHERMQKLGTAFRPPPEKARELFGEDYVRQIQQQDVQRLQQPRQQPTPPRGPNGQFQSANGGERPRQRFSSMRDFQRALDGKK